MAENKRKIYFTKEVENAIIEYNRINHIILNSKPNTDTLKLDITRNDIYARMIYPAIDKLVENIIHKWKFYKYETDYNDLKSDTVSYIYEQLHKYNPATGSKAYSYFTIVAKNFLLKFVMDQNASINKKTDLIELDLNRSVYNEMHYNDYQGILRDFLKEFTQFAETEINNIFKVRNEQKVASAVLDILKDPEYFQGFNKKLLYILIREQCGIDNTVYITRVTKILKQLFDIKFEEYYKEHYR